ncbi:DUF402 domain-containing protein [Streptomyces tendae]|uniref:DUF402 domain-containing protein n=1 Tax=Streptomyces tendae TaxID=1932 RepID=UPI0036582AD2
MLLRHVREGRTWCLLPVTVLHDDGDRIVLRIHADAVWLAAVRPDGRRAHGWERTWRLARTEWSGHDGTYVIDRGRWYGIAMFTDPASRSLKKWYVNAQDPIRRRPWGFDTMDRELDVEILPDDDRPRWKDRDRLRRLVRDAFISPERARRLMRECRSALHLLADPDRRADLLRWADSAAPVPALDAVLRTLVLPDDVAAASAPSASGPMCVRDDLTPRQVYIAGNRATRPSGTATRCPFCPGGRETPESFTTTAFPNRWPPIPAGRSEVVVHTPRHDVDFARMATGQIRDVVDLWADRTETLAAHEDVRCVLVFENRGAAAGATVDHAHSQLFALPEVPPLLRSPDEGRGGVGCPACEIPDPHLFVDEVRGWSMTVPKAPPAPYCVRISAPRHVHKLSQLGSSERDALATALTSAVQRMDHVFDERMPYQMWIQQALCESKDSHLTLTVAGLLRGPGRIRVLGAAELATGLYFTPVSPERAAAALRHAR